MFWGSFRATDLIFFRLSVINQCLRIIYFSAKKSTTGGSVEIYRKISAKGGTIYLFVKILWGNVNFPTLQRLRVVVQLYKNII